MSGDRTIGLAALDNSSDSLSSDSNLSVGALPNSLILGKASVALNRFALLAEACARIATHLNEEGIAKVICSSNSSALTIRTLPQFQGKIPLVQST